MTRLHTVFDTNVYIGLGIEALGEICAREQNCGVQAFASIWPCLEILAHCADRSDPQYQRSRNTLPKVWRHAGYEGRDGPRVRMHEAGDNTLAMGLFGRRMHERLLEHGFVAGLIRDAISKDSETFVERNADALSAIALRVASEETRFVRSLGDLVELIDAHGRADLQDAIQSDDGLRLVAQTKITSLASALGIFVDEDHLQVAVQRVINAFPIAIHFLRDLIVDVINSNMNFEESRNRNSTWDLKLAFHASAGGAVGGVPILLVTADSRTQRAAASAGQQFRVASLSEYQKLLSDAGALSDRVTLLRRPA
jgi:hypothetical protein